jgi:flavin reductase (DIM6/NTAB) family NADH-FMN oxidoreductase RutF
VSTNDQDKHQVTGNRSGGGIVFGGGSRTTARDATNLSEVAGGLRRRWTSGVAIVSGIDEAGGFRGVTVSSLMFVAQEPPVIAIALTTTNSFQALAGVDQALGVSILEAEHDFPAERFAGRAPLPDAQFSGISYRLVDGVPVIADALGWCVGRVRQRVDAGDHVLVLVDLFAGGLGQDTDDPLLSYEGRYRRLEAG